MRYGIYIYILYAIEVLENFEHLAAVTNSYFPQNSRIFDNFYFRFDGFTPPDMVVSWNLKQLPGGGHAMGECELLIRCSVNSFERTTTF